MKSLEKGVLAIGTHFPKYKLSNINFFRQKFIQNNIELLTQTFHLNLLYMSSKSMKT